MVNTDSKEIIGGRGDHEYFKELCAVATSGSLTDGESKELRMHLGACDQCRKLMQEYRELTRTGIAMLMPEVNEEHLATEESWSSSVAKQALFARIAAEEPFFKSRECDEAETVTNLGRIWQWLSHRGGWSGLQPAIRCASLALLLTTAVLSVYQTGKWMGERGGRLDEAKNGQTRGSARSLTTADPDGQKTQFSRLADDRAALEESLRAKSAELSELSERLKGQESELAKWKGVQGKTARELDENILALEDIQSRYAAATANGDLLGHQLQESRAALQEDQNRADAVRNQHATDVMSIVNMENQIAGLSVQLKDSEIAIQQQQQLLAHDRDIRELMGARRLYIADVYDFSENGKTQVPYGRVFYTTGKSLIFYAFDLDQEPNLRTASIFQAWGRRGTTDQRPLNMGIFYLDNAANNRWVLKFDDPKALAQIDAVFVTVEPRVGSQKPSGKPLLFASLRMVASNHP
jgi:hypothetical protein